MSSLSGESNAIERLTLFSGRAKVASLRVSRIRARCIASKANPGARPIGIYDRMDPVGAHEIVIETPEHGRTMSEHER